MGNHLFPSQRSASDLRAQATAYRQMAETSRLPDIGPAFLRLAARFDQIADEHDLSSAGAETPTRSTSIDEPAVFRSPLSTCCSFSGSNCGARNRTWFQSMT